MSKPTEIKTEGKLPRPSAKGASQSLQFLDPEAIELVARQVQEPPAPGSDAEKADLRALLERQDARSAQKCKIVLTDEEFEFSGFIKAAPDLFVNPGVAQEFLKLARATLADSEQVIMESQAHWSRPYPAHRNPAVQPCPEVKEVDKFSFPSGPVARHRIMFDLLMSVTFDENEKRSLKKYFEKFTENQTVSGAYSPSDVAAGIELGDKIFARLMKDASYTKDYKTVYNQTLYWHFRIKDEETSENLPHASEAKK